MLSKSFIILAFTVVAQAATVSKAPLKLSLSKRFNPTGTLNILEHDQARTHQMKSRRSSKSPLENRDGIDTPATNQGVHYTVAINVGNPPTSYNVIIDSGSSNTWVGAASACPTGCTATSDTVVCSNNSEQEKSNWNYDQSVTYGSGSFSGDEVICDVNLGSNLAVSSQSMGCATSSRGFAPYDGVLGIGPVDLTKGTLSPDSSASIPTIVDNAFSQGVISDHSIGISFEPTTTDQEVNGELSWGGVDSSKFTGSLGWVPITSTSPASQHWGIDATIVYGDSTTIPSGSGIVDTATTLILIATDAFSGYKSATGGVMDSSTGLLTITSSQFSSLQTLNFNIGGVTYGLTPNGQIWPRSLNSLIGGTANNIYLIVADNGSQSGSGLDFTLGLTFLERFYCVLDTGNQRVGFATTPYTEATTN